MGDEYTFDKGYQLSSFLLHVNHTTPQKIYGSDREFDIIPDQIGDALKDWVDNGKARIQKKLVRDNVIK